MYDKERMHACMHSCMHACVQALRSCQHATVATLYYAVIVVASTTGQVRWPTGRTVSRADLLKVQQCHQKSFLLSVFDWRILWTHR